MILRKDFLALNFYKKSDFFGSRGNMNYRISRQQSDAAGENGETKEEAYLRVWYWPGPYIFAKTADELKQEKDFPFSEEGLCAIADFLNEQYEKQAELFENADF